MARANFYLGQHDQARMLGERGMQQLAEGTREFALCAVIVGLVRVYQGKSAQGQKYLLLARDVLATAGTASDHAFAANALALSYHKAKDFEEASRFYLLSHEIASRSGDMERTHIALMNLSVVAQETANYGEAVSRYRAVLAMAVQANNRPVLARVLANLGTLHRYLGLLEKARTYAAESLSVAVALESAHQTGLATMLLGEIAAFMGENEEASRRLEDARRIFEELKEQDECLEVDIDRLELGILNGSAASVLRLADAVQDAARTLGLADHRVRASLAACWAYLEEGSSGSLSKAATALAFLRTREPELENPEHRWRLAILELGHDLASARDGSLLPPDVRKVEKSFADLKNRIPQEFQASFLQRIDRAALQKRSQACLGSAGAVHKGDAAMASRPDSLLTGARWMARIVAVNRRMLGDATLEQLLEAIIDEVVDLSGAERGFVILGNEERLDVVAARNMDREGVRRSRTKFSTTVARGVLRTGEMVMLEDAVESDDYRQQVSIVAQRIRSVIALPLSARGQTIGALYLDHRFRGGVFTHDVVGMLKAFSEQAALAVENKRLLEQFRGTVTELEASRNEVQRLNHRLEEKISVQETLLRQQSREIDLQQEQLGLQSQFSSILGRSKAIQSLFGVMNRVKGTSVPVLVTGESGTGKELVARALHFNGSRSKKRFVSINCAALPDTLLESELFGHSKGAFTGAAGDKKGLFSLADQGTLLLDEVGDMSLTMQAKILRVLQEGEFSALGSERLTKVDVRVISATNRDLKSMVKTGEFREDLYYRLDVVSIRVPPLRERSEDIPLLVDHFLRQFAAGNDQRPCRVAPDAMHVLLTYPWPGNVRELHSVIMTASVFAQDGLITVESLQTKPEVLAQRPPRVSAWTSTLNLRDLERLAIEAAMEQAGGNKVQAARLLGISRRALYNKRGG